MALGRCSLRLSVPVASLGSAYKLPVVRGRMLADRDTGRMKERQSFSVRAASVHGLSELTLFLLRWLLNRDARCSDVWR